MIKNIFYLNDNSFKLWLKSKLKKYVPQQVRYYKKEFENNLSIDNLKYTLPASLTKSCKNEYYYYVLKVFPHGKKDVDIYVMN